jgi:hypothetical protein
MSKTVVPDVAAVIRCIGDTMDEIILPALTTPVQRSAGATMRHLLRYAAAQIDTQGQMLLDEQHRLHKLLGEACIFLDGIPAGTALAAAIRATRAEKRDPTIYPSLSLMASEVGNMRQHVCDLLVILQSLNSAGESLHNEIRAYIAWQIEQEGKVVEPAFLGFGPRR